MAEAESVFHKRPKMASSALLSIEDALECSALEEANKDQTVAPMSPPAFQETPPETSGRVSSSVLSLPMVIPAMPSTLKKSGKKKPNQSSKVLSNKHSKKTSCATFGQCDGVSEECPYSDLESVPKILCSKALERQQKPPAVVQPPVAAAKEVKKQPKVQTGLWFSKSGKDRRPKTISPTPDRSLFSKVPNKKKSSPAVGKRSLAPGSLCGPADHSGLSEKPKTPVPVETKPTLEMKCKHRAAADTTSHRAALSTGKPPLPVDAVRPSNKGAHPEGQHLVSDPSHKATPTEPDRSDSKKAPKPNMEATLDDQSRISDRVKSVAQPEPSEDARKAKSEEREVIETFGDGSNVSATEREEQARLMAKCRMPFVKLIRKEVQVNNASVTVGSSDQPECADVAKSLDTNVTPVQTKSDCASSIASFPVGPEAKAEPAKVAVRKVKASSGTSLLCLSSEPVKIILSSNMSKLSETGRPDEERIRLDITPNTGDHPPSPPPPLRKSSQSSELPGQPAPAPVAYQQSATLGCSALPSNKRFAAVVRGSKRPSGKARKHVLPEQPAHLPASSRLMSRALKAMQEREKSGKARKAQKQNEGLAACTSKKSTRTPEAKPERPTKTNSHCKTKDEVDRDTLSSCSTPTIVSSDTTDCEVDVKSEDEDLSISSTPPMDFIPLTSKIKSKEDSSSEVCSSSSRSSPFYFMNAFKNLEEVSFQSLTSEADGKPVSFRANKNYKYSTILMMLKDLHDARERDGTPLELQIGPPSAHVKEEPLVMPGEAPTPGNHELSSDNNHVNQNKFTQNEERPWLVSKRSFLQKGNSNGLKKKANRRVPSQPSRSGPGFPGLESPAAADSSGVASPSQSGLEVKPGHWERLTGGLDGVTRDKPKMWSSVAEDLENMVPLEQRACSTALCQGQPKGLLADYSESDALLMRKVGEGDKSRTGKE